MESNGSGTVVPSLLESNVGILSCPACGGDVELSQDETKCLSCSNRYRSERGIPLLFWPTEWDDSHADVTEIVKSFYEENPFPDYEDLDSSWSLREKATKGRFAALLDDQIPFGSRVLEVGCGTGQLSNFLGMSWGKSVFGADMCLNSLKLAHGFKRKNSIDNAAFVQMNLFRPAFKAQTFDFVICNGVLHHTSDPFGGFQSIARLVKPGGFISVGLYNTYGRIGTDVRRLLFRITGNRFKRLDPRLRQKSVSSLRKQTWFLDQYKNPHESKHTYGEVLRWFDATGFEFINSIPKSKPGEEFSPEERLFEPHPRSTTLDRFLVQLAFMLSGSKEGGLFVTIGRKRA